MNLTKKIARMIERKLSFSNGWKVDDVRYYQLCHELAEEIIRTVSKEKE